MKYFLLSIICITSSLMMNAQNFVSTTAENRNVVLEEFTGIKCTFCPDGHLKAQQLYDANPNDVVLINIHVGNYANPNAGQPDFRTSFGTAISGQSNLTGYPAGTINRRPFSNTGPSSNPSGTGQGNCSTCTAMSRGYWTPSAGIVLTEASEVNVANQSSIDINSGDLTSVTEVYYTGNSATTSNFLNVVLLQDNVPGPQTGASYNPSAILPNGDYNHMHMLRHMLTGQWGSTINTTTASYFQADTLVYTIPADYTGVATSFPDMTVSVFITETQQTVTTGANAAMTYIMPPGSHDVSTSGGDFGVSNYCTNGSSWTPSFTAVNETVNAITSIEAQYTINGGTPVTTSATGLNLAQSSSTIVTFPTVALPGGVNDIVYSINTINGSAADVISSNNTGLTGSIAALTSAPTATTIMEDFQTPNITSGTWSYSQSWDGIIINNPDNLPENRFGILAYGGTTYDLDQCIRACYGSTSFPDNSSGDFIFDNINLSSMAAANLTFDYSHAEETAGTGDGALEIFASTDCGSTWTSVWSRSGSTLSTSAALSGNFFYPQDSTDWQNAQVDLSAYVGNSSVSIKFAFSKGTSANNLYVDNINVDVVSSINDIDAVSSLSIMPNPVVNSMNIEFSLVQPKDLNIAIFNSLGQLVETVAASEFEGENIITVNTNKFSSGIYFLNISSATEVNSKRFVISK
ncbi:MAG: T9SS type A sorting domain-containing protein [Saprospiraceae bacterium]|nr:T9SS type A sorting domain-containing protein [Saprospiraceae bacterium]